MLICLFIHLFIYFILRIFEFISLYFTSSSKVLEMAMPCSSKNSEKSSIKYCLQNRHWGIRIGGFIALKYLLLLNNNSIMNYHDNIFDIIIGCLDDPVDDVCGAAADVIKSLVIGRKKNKIGQEAKKKSGFHYAEGIEVNRRNQINNNIYNDNNDNEKIFCPKSLEIREEDEKKENEEKLKVEKNEKSILNHLLHLVQGLKRAVSTLDLLSCRVFSLCTGYSSTCWLLHDSIECSYVIKNCRNAHVSCDLPQANSNDRSHNNDRSNSNERYNSYDNNDNNDNNNDNNNNSNSNSNGRNNNSNNNNDDNNDDINNDHDKNSNNYRNDNGNYVQFDEFGRDDETAIEIVILLTSTLADLFFKLHLYCKVTQLKCLSALKPGK